MIRTGSILIKEDAVICLSTISETALQDFLPYYQSVVQEISYYMTQTELKTEDYYQFKAHIIEAIISISSSVGVQNFKQISE